MVGKHPASTSHPVCGFDRRSGRQSRKKSADGGGQGQSIIRDDGRYARSVIYGYGAAIGFTPRQIDEMTMWELTACVAGFNRANSADADLSPPTDEEFQQMLEAYDVSH